LYIPFFMIRYGDFKYFTYTLIVGNGKIYGI